MNATSPAVQEVAAKLGVSPVWLDNLIYFESGWNPQARNVKSGARGLIQFMPATARSLGYAGADALVAEHDTAESQLRGPVLTYLTAQKPFPTEQSFYLSVFYPKAKFWPLSTVFSSAVRAQNPGIFSVADYYFRVKFWRSRKWIALALAAALAGSAAYLTFSARGA